jgi:hypothetical protein
MLFGTAIGGGNPFVTVIFIIVPIYLFPLLDQICFFLIKSSHHSFTQVFQ